MPTATAVLIQRATETDLEGYVFSVRELGMKWQESLMRNRLPPKKHPPYQHQRLVQTPLSRAIPSLSTALETRLVKLTAKCT
jgi:hypothetical protein